MLVRLLGKDEEAKAGTWTTPFTDVVDWAEPYVGYAYANKLTSGTSATTFGGNAEVSAVQYLTFVLRALGYKDGTDFQWDRAWELSDRIGLMQGRYSATNNDSFLRADIALISFDALSNEVKGTGNTLLEKIQKKENGKPQMNEGMAAVERNWSSYGMPASMSPTLSWEQAKALFGKGIDEVSASIKTLGDCIYYCAASGMGITPEGDIRLSTEKGYEWHFNYTPEVVLIHNHFAADQLPASPRGCFKTIMTR